MEKIEIAVVGGGAAGIAAAIEAAKAGAQVTLLDENGQPGGQLFKQIHKFFGSEDHRAGIRGVQIGRDLLKEAADAGVIIKLNTLVYGLFSNHGQQAPYDTRLAGGGKGHNIEGYHISGKPRSVGGELHLGLVCGNHNEDLRAEIIILATGANENPLAFPGWTLPGVLGAGAAQTLINIHRTLPGNHILMVGAGNVGLIVAYQLLQAGAEVVAIIEGLSNIGGYGVHASKVRRAGVPILTGYTILRAEGEKGVERAVIVNIDDSWQPVPHTEQILEVDTICLAVGLSPLAELAWMAGCRFIYLPQLGGWIPIHDQNMKSTVSSIYVAGDLTGIEEASTAMEEGRLAGLAAAEALGHLAFDVAEKKKGEVRTRLAMLRVGSFGEGREFAKEQILKTGIEG
jgi:thioredoxin reductase